MPRRFDNLWKVPDRSATLGAPAPSPREAPRPDLPSKTRAFVADSAADALSQIRRELGPEAVVLQVRQIPASSFSQLWQKRQVEVVAGVPEKQPENGRLDELIERIALLNHHLPPLPGNTPATLRPRAGGIAGPSSRPAAATLPAVLESIGLLPEYARRLAEQVHGAQSRAPAYSPADELGRAGGVLESLWRKGAGLDPSTPTQTHVLVGAPGAGKTTCLCKWLAHCVLLGGHSAHVWRWDGRAANTADALSVYGEILGVPVARSFNQDEPPPPVAIRFVDLPGVDWQEPGAVAELREQVERIENARVHLVLNAAYETPILLAQVEAFASLPVADLIFSHLDEESRWGKLWNFFVATEYAMAFLSAGQNVPGAFYEASARRLLPAEFF